MEKIYLNSKEVCEMLDISPSKLYKMTSKNEIPVFRFGRLLKFKKADLVQFVESNYTHQMTDAKISPIEFHRLPSLAA